MLEMRWRQASERELIADAAAARLHRPGPRLLAPTRGRVGGAEARGRQHQARRVRARRQRIPEFVASAPTLLAERSAPARGRLPFGHFGDGNVHYNVSQPVGMAKRRLHGAVGPDRAAPYTSWWWTSEGSISAEHGIGFMKKHELVHFKSEVELDLMRKIKVAFDPKGILNPGKML